MRVAPDRPDHSENVGVALSQNPVIAATAATVTLYSADGLIAVQEHDSVIADVPKAVSNVTGDDDLTSLTWLQDKNLLKSVPELPKHDYIDDGANDSTLSNSSASSVSSHKASSQCANLIPRLSYDPQVHVNAKPPFSFSSLIFMAIEDSEDKALPVKDIYVWIVNHFPYYRNAPIGWKNSVRHNLSLNKCFRKVEKSPHLGKGSLWMVEQRFRPCLIQALQKTPHHQYPKFVRNLNVNKKTVNDNISVCDKVDDKLNVRNEIQEHMKTETIYIKEENLDDVDAAATAMLVLKHGADAFDIKTENVDFVLGNEVVAGNRKISDTKSETINGPNDDHNYGYHFPSSIKLTSAITSVDMLPINEKEPVNSHRFWSTVRDDIEEQRKIVEGADALLNLAGITTTPIAKKRPLTYYNDEHRTPKQQFVDQSPSSSHCKLRQVRKNRYTIDVNSRESITAVVPNPCSDVSNDSVSAGDVDDIEQRMDAHRIKPRSRATPVSNRRLRKKLEKKRIKL